RAARLLERAEALARQIDDSYAHAFAMLVKGIACYMGEGRWRQSLAFLDEADAVLRTAAAGDIGGGDTTITIALWSPHHMGGFGQLARRGATLLREADDHGDLFAATNFRTYIMVFVRLASDDPQGARAELAEAMGRWSQQGFHVQHHNALLARVYTDLYEG